VQEVNLVRGDARCNAQNAREFAASYIMSHSVRAKKRNPVYANDFMTPETKPAKPSSPKQTPQNKPQGGEKTQRPAGKNRPSDQAGGPDHKGGDPHEDRNP
jgi:hypothetical protein